MALGGMKVLLGVMIVILIGLIIAPIIIAQAVTATTTTGIGSFVGLIALLGLVPLGFAILIIWWIFNQVRGGAKG